MKIKQFLLIALVSLFSVIAFSCSKDEDSQTIVGAFDVYENRHYTVLDYVAVDKWEESRVRNEVWTFKADGAFEYYDSDSYGTYSYVGNYTLKNNKLTIKYDASDIDGDVDVYPIKELTADKIILECEECSGGSTTNGKVDEKYDGDVVLKRVK
jgi:hypothetical protein